MSESFLIINDTGSKLMPRNCLGLCVTDYGIGAWRDAASPGGGEDEHGYYVEHRLHRFKGFTSLRS